MQASISKEAAMNFQNNIGIPAIPELTGNAPAVMLQNIFFKRQSCRDMVVCPALGAVISNLGSSTWGKKTSEI